jgi:hypothetical protein
MPGRATVEGGTGGTSQAMRLPSAFASSVKGGFKGPEGQKPVQSQCILSSPLGDDKSQVKYSGKKVSQEKEDSRNCWEERSAEAEDGEIWG